MLRPREISGQQTKQPRYEIRVMILICFLIGDYFTRTDDAWDAVP
jgi:hypothetical protein